MAVEKRQHKESAHQARQPLTDVPLLEDKAYRHTAPHTLHEALQKASPRELAEVIDGYSRRRLLDEPAPPSDILAEETKALTLAADRELTRQTYRAWNMRYGQGPLMFMEWDEESGTPPHGEETPVRMLSKRIAAQCSRLDQKGVDDVLARLNEVPEALALVKEREKRDDERYSLKPLPDAEKTAEKTRLPPKPEGKKRKKRRRQPTPPKEKRQPSTPAPPPVKKAGESQRRGSAEPDERTTLLDGFIGELFTKAASAANPEMFQADIEPERLPGGIASIATRYNKIVGTQVEVSLTEPRIPDLKQRAETVEEQFNRFQTRDWGSAMPPDTRVGFRQRKVRDNHLLHIDAGRPGHEECVASIVDSDLIRIHPQRKPDHGPRLGSIVAAEYLKMRHAD